MDQTSVSRLRGRSMESTEVDPWKAPRSIHGKHRGRSMESTEVDPWKAGDWGLVIHDERRDCIAIIIIIIIIIIVTTTTVGISITITVMKGCTGCIGHVISRKHSDWHIPANRDESGYSTHGQGSRQMTCSDEVLGILRTRLMVCLENKLVPWYDGQCGKPQTAKHPRIQLQFITVECWKRNQCVDMAWECLFSYGDSSWCSYGDSS